MGNNTETISIINGLNYNKINVVFIPESSDRPLRDGLSRNRRGDKSVYICNETENRFISDLNKGKVERVVSPNGERFLLRPKESQYYSEYRVAISELTKRIYTYKIVNNTLYLTLRKDKKGGIRMLRLIVTEQRNGLNKLLKRHTSLLF